MDLSTRYLGLTLQHPLIASASPLSKTADGVRRLEDSGAAAVVMASIYEEEIRADETLYAQLVEHGSYTQPEAAGYFPAYGGDGGGAGGHLDVVRRAVEAVDIPVIASLNGSTQEGWISFAKDLEDVGAAAIELNIYRVPADLSESGAEVERGYVEIVKAVKRAVTVPVAVKLSPYFSSVGHLAASLVEAGADGLVLFNRFYEADIDISSLTLRSDLRLSNPYEMRLAQMWIALLHGKLRASLAATTGVAGHEEVIKYLLAGADAVMTTSMLLRHGPGCLQSVRQEVEKWLAARGFRSVAEARGRMSAQRIANPEALVRAQYVKILTQHGG
jgi:dihydroorotate dehydrogenase (fumarate)